MSVLFVGHIEMEDLHLVSVRPQKGAALDLVMSSKARQGQARNKKSQSRFHFELPTPEMCLALISDSGLRASSSPYCPHVEKAVGAGPHLFVALVAGHNN